MIWFYQGLWYMITHLRAFFKEVWGIAAKFMAFIHFLSEEAKDTVLDHIAFLFIWVLMIEACMSLYHNPLAPILKERMNMRAGIMIERVIKPSTFTNELLNKGSEVPPKRQWDLNESSSSQ